MADHGEPAEIRHGGGGSEAEADVVLVQDKNMLSRFLFPNPVVWVVASVHTDTHNKHTHVRARA